MLLSGAGAGSRNRSRSRLDWLHNTGLKGIFNKDIYVNDIEITLQWFRIRVWIRMREFNLFIAWYRYISSDRIDLWSQLKYDTGTKNLI